MNYTPLLEKIYPWVIFRIKSFEQNILFLTFDDGPEPESTDRIAEILEDHSVKATFFVVGCRAEKHPDLVEQLFKSGHSIGNHSFTHQKFYTPGAIYDELTRTQSLLSAINGHKPELYRPPYGRIFPGYKKKIQELHLNTVLWDVISRDYKNSISSNQIIANCAKQAEDGSIILFHDHSRTVQETIKALPVVIKTFSDNGFKFKALSDVL